MVEQTCKNSVGIIAFFEKNTSLNILDLGCGVGRNCIPIAQKYGKIDCKIDCVDILESAIYKLYQYSEKYGVRSQINGIVMPIEDYRIKQNSYDLILAISSLEHVKSEDIFWRMMKEIAKGICDGGFVCLIINTNILEMDKESGIQREPQFEVNLQTSALKEGLREVFGGWSVMKHTVVHQEYDIPRDKNVYLSTDVVTWVVRKFTGEM